MRELKSVNVNLMFCLSLLLTSKKSFLRSIDWGLVSMYDGMLYVCRWELELVRVIWVSGCNVSDESFWFYEVFGLFKFWRFFCLIGFTYIEVILLNISVYLKKWISMVLLLCSLYY